MKPDDSTATACSARCRDKELVLRVMPMPADSNSNGDIFGGWIMAQVDLAGSVLPARIARGRITTVAVNQFIFKQPVSRRRPAELLCDASSASATPRSRCTSRCYAERNPADLQVVKVTEANLTYVAIDRDGKPRQIPRMSRPTAEALATDVARRRPAGIARRCPAGAP